jgi:hypothetical protein
MSEGRTNWLTVLDVPQSRCFVVLMRLLLLFDLQFNYLLSCLLSQPLHVSKRSIDRRFAHPWESAWTPVEVEECELSLYLQLLDSVAVHATMSDFGTTICVESGLEEVE